MIHLVLFEHNNCSLLDIKELLNKLCCFNAKKIAYSSSH